MSYVTHINQNGTQHKRVQCPYLHHSNGDLCMCIGVTHNVWYSAARHLEATLFNLQFRLESWINSTSFWWQTSQTRCLALTLITGNRHPLSYQTGRNLKPWLVGVSARPLARMSTAHTSGAWTTGQAAEGEIKLASNTEKQPSRRTTFRDYKHRRQQVAMKWNKFGHIIANGTRCWARRTAFPAWNRSAPLWCRLLTVALAEDILGRFAQVRVWGGGSHDVCDRTGRRAQYLALGGKKCNVPSVGKKVTFPEKRSLFLTLRQKEVTVRKNGSGYIKG